MFKKFLIGIIYLVILAVLSVLLMDVYGLIGDDDEIIIEIKENDNLDVIATELVKNKVIINKDIFKQFYKINTRKSVLVPGTIVVNSKMPYHRITRIIDEPTLDTVRFTIPEGFEIREIASRFEDNEIFSADAFKTALKNFSYTFKTGEEISGDKYLLSGYLYPDTYEFYRTSPPYDIILKMVKNFEKHWTEEYKKQAEKLGMTMNEIITLASIVEREARHEEDFPKVAAVFHNRLKIKKPLESCATVQYILEERKPVLSILNTQIDSPFNTYKNAGLPPSPIAAPGDLAIKSTLFPEKSDKIFFFTDKEGINRYSVTYEEHNSQIAKYKLSGQ